MILKVYNLTNRPVVAGFLLIPGRSSIERMLTVAQLERVAEALTKAQQDNLIRFSTSEDPEVSNSVEGATIDLASGAGRSFVYRPGATPGFGIYDDWAKLVAAAQLVMAKKTVILDDTYNKCDIPAGVWDFGEYWTEFQGKATRSVVTFLDGCYLKRVNEFTLLDMTTQATNPVLGIQPRVGNSTFILRNASIRSTSATAFFLTDEGLLRADWHLLEGAHLITDAAPCLGASARNSSLLVLAYDNSVVDDNSLINYPNTGKEGIIIDSGAQMSTVQLPPMVVTKLEDAATHGYTPGASGNWDGDPADLQEAMDRMASLLYTLNGDKPIP